MDQQQGQGQPPPPPPGGQPPAEGGGAAEGAQMVKDVYQGLQMILELIGQSGAPPEAAQIMEQVIGGFEKVVSILSGGAQKAPPGQSPMEAGPNSRPVGPQG